MRTDNGGSSQITVYYDGHCGLCHGLVKILLRLDRDGGWFRYAPLDSRSFQSRTTELQRAQLPDSVVVFSPGGTPLARSAAVLAILRHMGGVWRMAAWVAGLIPTHVLDAGYNWVARNRYQWFGKATVACPIVPPHLRSRFEA